MESKLEQLTGGTKPQANRLGLTGVFGLVAPLAATVGLFKASGTIGRIQRDDPYLLWLAIGLVLIAGTMVSIATFLAGEGQSGEAKRWERRLYLGAAATTAVGFALALLLVFGNAGAESRPQISAELNPEQSQLTAHVTASHLQTDRRLALKVDLATVRDDQTVDSVHPFARYGTLPLERAYMGPDSDGNVDQQITLSIPPGGRYTNVVIKAYTGATNQSCRELAQGADPGTACTILALDRAAAARGEASGVRLSRSCGRR